LKKQALEEAVYGLVECGVSSIYLLDTDKVQRDWGGDKEYERLYKICIAAAEQSKNYAMPQIHKPISLNEFIKQHAAYTKLFFDPAGASIMATISDRKHENICCIVGPEGDLTESEKDLLRTQQFNFCHLTPTILRAQQAVVVAVGALRSIIV
jgi:16S rRNA (uracil1498-N3)-methyltransferase